MSHDLARQGRVQWLAATLLALVPSDRRRLLCVDVFDLGLRCLIGRCGWLNCSPGCNTTTSAGRTPLSRTNLPPPDSASTEPCLEKLELGCGAITMSVTLPSRQALQESSSLYEQGGAQVIRADPVGACVSRPNRQAFTNAVTRHLLPNRVPLEEASSADSGAALRTSSSSSASDDPMFQHGHHRAKALSLPYIRCQQRH